MHPARDSVASRVPPARQEDPRGTDLADRWSRVGVRLRLAGAALQRKTAARLPLATGGPKGLATHGLAAVLEDLAPPTAVTARVSSRDGARSPHSNEQRIFASNSLCCC